MPKRRNQGQSVSSLEKNLSEIMSTKSDFDLKWRDTTCRELQSMFSGSVDPEVIQLVLSESNFNVNDAIEKLFVLSGIEENLQPVEKKPESAHLSTSSSQLSGENGRQYISEELGFVKDHQTKNGSQCKSKVQATIECSGLKSSHPAHIEKDVVETDSVLHAASFSGAITASGLPDFPDTVSQQFRELQNQGRASNSAQHLFLQEPSKHEEMLQNRNKRTSTGQIEPRSFEAQSPFEMAQHKEYHKVIGAVESELKGRSSKTASSKDWKKAPFPTEEVQQTESQLSEKKTDRLIVGTTVTEASHSKRENKLKTEPLVVNNQKSKRKTSPPQNVQNTLSTSDSRKPWFQSAVNSIPQLPTYGIANGSPRKSFTEPPVIQRQFQPLLPSQGYGHVVPAQQRLGLVPVVQSPWQQGLLGHLPSGPFVPQGQTSCPDPLGSLPYRPPFIFSRAHPSASVRQVRPASAASVHTRIPFIPIIDQKLLILIRGLPGSGKSTLAKKLKGAQGITLSTDDYFYRNQRYEFDTAVLGEAHEWNQKRAKNALEKQISPVVIDNTNTQCWEMKPYVLMGKRLGYHIKFIEPETSWKWNVRELARRNQHRVGIAAISRMKERYEHNVSVEKIINCEEKFEHDKARDDCETNKRTGTDNQNTAQRSSPERGSAENCPGEKVSDGLDGNESRNTFKAGELVGEIKRGVQEKRLKDRPNSERAIEAEVHCESDGGSEFRVVNEITTNENRDKCSPKPQRRPRIRERRTADTRLPSNTGSPGVICKDSMIEQHQEEQPPNKILVEHEHGDQSDTSPMSEPKLIDAVSSDEDLEHSDVSSFSDSPASSLKSNKTSNEEDLLEEATSSQLSESSISGLETASSSECEAPVLCVPLKDTLDSIFNVTSDANFTKEVSLEENIKYDLKSAEEISGVSQACDNDVNAKRGRNVLKYHKSSDSPPPLSAILASASRSKQKKRGTSSDFKQPLADERKSKQPNHVQQPMDPEPEVKSEQFIVKEESTQSDLSERGLHSNSSQENDTSAEDVFSDVQIQSDVSNEASCGDSESDVIVGLEFLKTCFPYVDSDLLNSLLIAESGDVMKVVDELLADNGRLPDFTADASEFTEQQSLLGAVSASSAGNQISLAEESSLAKKPNSMKQADKILSVVDSSLGSNQENTVSPVKGLGELLTGMEGDHSPGNPSPNALSPAQSPGHSTFQLTLDPAVALHLIEVFGQFVGVNFQESINPEDLIIDVDKSFAKQLYKKWEMSVQARKGISAGKRGRSPLTSRDPTDARNFVIDQRSAASHRSSPRLSTKPHAGSLKEIMDEELALALSRIDNAPRESDQDIATNLKRKKLYEMFPGVDPVALEEVFQATSYALDPAVEAVKASCNLSEREIPSVVVASGPQNRVTQEDVTRKEAEEDWSWLCVDVPDSTRSGDAEGPFQTLEAPSYRDFRAEAYQHHKLRDECFKKAALAFSNKQGQLAQFYAQQGRVHTQKMKEANARAAALILDQTNEGTDENTIDLHGLHVNEAIEVLQNLLIEKSDPNESPPRKGSNVISVITGRGNNSRGGKARIKPAIVEYLKKNNYRYTEPHPGQVNVHL